MPWGIGTASGGNVGTLPDDAEREFVNAYLRGYRFWRYGTKVTVRDDSTPKGWVVVGDEPTLKATNFGISWETKLKAECVETWNWFGTKPKNSHPSPQEKCTCGIYCWYTPDHAHYRSFWGSWYGIVRCWGKTILGQAGMRTQQAEIIAVAPAIKIYYNNKPLKPPEHLIRDKYPGVEIHPDPVTLEKSHEPDDYTTLVGDELQQRDLDKALAGNLPHSSTLNYYFHVPSEKTGDYSDVDLSYNRHTRQYVVKQSRYSEWPLETPL